MTELKFFIAGSYDVYENQAYEKYLLDHLRASEVILYLWQNDRTVVIGRNQDAYSECDIEKLETDGGRLARRISGGGAVYHDKGNLNFTFLSSRKLYDVCRQDEIIIAAINKLGIQAEKNGRNDLLINGRKFSGHAYYQGKDACLHHGTLMLEVNEDQLARYLQVPLIKLQAKNVASVRSRIINLKAVKPDLKIIDLKQALIEAAEENYGCKAAPYTDIDEKEIGRLKAEFEDPLWRYGKQIHFSNTREKRFGWGTIRVSYDLKDGIIDDLAFYTDALELKAFEGLKEKLLKQKISELDIEDKNEIEADIISLLKGEEDAI